MITPENRRDKQARDIILRMVANFPGLVLDQDECDAAGKDIEVPGAELVEWLTNEFVTCRAIGDTELAKWAEDGSPDGEAIEDYWHQLWSC